MTSVKTEASADYNDTKSPDVATHSLPEEAIRAENVEKNMPLWTTIKLYRKAVGWSVAVSLCLVMEGYMTSVIGNASAYSIYREKFGYYTGETNGFQISAPWTSAISQGAIVGDVIGIFIASWMQDRYGYRITLQLFLVLMAAFIFIPFFAPNVQVLVVGQVLLGLPWGAFSSSAVAYATEVAPIGLRGYLTTYVNMCWLIGQITAAGVALALSGRTDEWAYKLQFGLQWMFPLPIFILVSFAPESPWFYVRRGRTEEAEKAVKRLASEAENVSAAETVAMMIRTNRIELETREGASYWDCLKGANLRRTEIACVAWMCTSLAGAQFANHPAYFLQQAGLSTTAALQINLAQRGLAMVGTLLSWIVMTYVGRRKTFFFGLMGDAACLLVVGFCAIPGDQIGAKWGIAGMILLWVFVWDLSVTVTAYAIVGESGSTRMRAKTVGLARTAYNVINIPLGILQTYQVNATAWNWKGYAGFFWFGTCILALVWAYFRLPEMKGRSFRELDILFERGVPARKFDKTVILEEEES